MRSDYTMVYQQAQDKGAYAKEAANIAAQMQKFHQAPKGKLGNHYLTHVLIALAMVIAVCGLMAWDPTKPVFCILTGALLILIILYFWRILMFKKTISMTVQSQGNRQVEIDSKGFTSSYDTHSVTYFWDGIQVIRAFRYSVLLLPKKPYLSGIILPIENFEQIKSFIEENHIQVEILE